MDVCISGVSARRGSTVLLYVAGVAWEELRGTQELFCLRELAYLARAGLVHESRVAMKFSSYLWGFRATYGNLLCAISRAICRDFVSALVRRRGNKIAMDKISLYTCIQ